MFMATAQMIHPAVADRLRGRRTRRVRPTYIEKMFCALGVISLGNTRGRRKTLLALAYSLKMVALQS